MAFRKFGVTALGTILGGTFATYSLRQNEEVLARVEMEGKPIKRARKLPMRAEQLTALQAGEEYDVLIIGGGATGAGCALDACTRGLKTALVEANDFASGTSSRSTKLIHGGVRYLQNAIMGVRFSEFQHQTIFNHKIHFSLTLNNTTWSKKPSENAPRCLPPLLI